MIDRRPPLLESLRRQTRADHHGLDAHPILVRLVRPELDQRHYAEALVALHPAQQALEAFVAQGLQNLSMEYPFNARMAWLEKDLERLGGLPPPASGRKSAPPTSLAELVGLLYVLEGSRLGASVIAQRVRVSLGDDIPLAFFDNADGERTWPVFRDFATTHCPMGQAEVAIRSARQAFGCFRRYLEASRMLDTSPTD